MNTETFESYIKNAREAFSNVWGETRDSYTPKEKVIVENLLIAYDQMAKNQSSAVSDEALNSIGNYVLQNNVVSAKHEDFIWTYELNKSITAAIKSAIQSIDKSALSSSEVKEKDLDSERDAFYAGREFFVSSKENGQTTTEYTYETFEDYQLK